MRNFNAHQKSALLIRAGFRCSICHKRVSFRTSHADHIVPFSKGGETRLSNGQILCPECNLKKGAKMNRRPLPWQSACLRKYERHEEQDFIVVAGTGTGKTFAGALCAKRTLQTYPDSVILVACPYRGIKRGWAGAFEPMGLEVAVAPNQIAQDTNVIVSTYAGVKGVLDYHVKEIRKRLILVFDEFHHMEENNTWAEPFMNMSQDLYLKRIFLSGTPWHETGNLKEFVPYDDNNEVIADFVYTYGMNVNGSDEERNTVPVMFHPVRVEGRNRRGGEGIEAYSEDYDSDNSFRSEPFSKYLAFQDVVEFVRQDGLVKLLDDAVSSLDRIRAGQMPKAGGIVFTSGMKSANAVKDVMKSRHDIDASVIVSDDPKAHHILDTFRKNSDRWIIAIDMVSEGVDIPRLKVVADLSNRSTMMHIIQRWGRVLRRVRDSSGNPLNECDARIFHIGHAQLNYVAHQIEEDIRKHKLDKEGSGSEETPPECWRVPESQTGEDKFAIFKGKSIEDQERLLADAILFHDFNNIRTEGLGLRGALNLARYLIANNQVPEDLVNGNWASEQVKPTKGRFSKESVVAEYTKLTQRIAYAFFNGKNDIKAANKAANKALNDRMGVRYWSRDNKTLDELIARLEHAKELYRVLSNA